MKISNNLLYILLIFSIFISIFSSLVIFLSFNSFNLFTGFATNTSEVNLRVIGETSCDYIDNSINFSYMYRGANNNSELVKDFIKIENTGQTNIDVKVISTDELWDSAGYLTPNECWQVHCNSSQSGYCYSDYVNVPNTAEVILVSDLGSNAFIDESNVGVNITVPPFEAVGPKVGILTFTCTAS